MKTNHDYKAGDRVMITASGVINNAPYLNIPGEVELVGFDEALVRVLVKAKGQRKPRSLVVHNDTLKRC